MSNHFSAANLKFPGDDARLDLTDLYVFRAPETRSRTRTCSPSSWRYPTTCSSVRDRRSACGRR